MPANRTLTITGLQDYLTRLGRSLTEADMRPAWKVVRLLLSSSVKENFAGSHTPDGTPWPPLKNPSKKRGGASAKPLRDTGLLFASITSAATVTETAAEITYGTGLFYAGFHQFGTRHIPAREFVGFNPRLEAKIVATVTDHLQRLLRDASDAA